MLQKTALHSVHLAQDAKLVDFHGWEMPLNYGSQLEEHHAVRQRAGMFDVSHMTIVDFKGAQAADCLRYLLAGDVAKLENYQAMYSLMLNESGGIIDDLIAYRFKKDYFRLVLNSASCERDLSWIEQHAEQFDVFVQWRQDLSIIAVQGPHAKEWTAGVLEEESGLRIQALKSFQSTWIDDALFASTGYTGEAGYEIMLPHDKAEKLWLQLANNKVVSCGLAARDTLRLEAGLNLYGNDMDDTTNPYQSGLGWTVCLQDEGRDFLGRQALLAIRKQERSERFVGLILQDKGVLRTGQQIVVEGVGAGVITSGGFSPVLQKGIAMARIPYTLGETSVVIRGQQKPVSVVKLPFIRRGRSTYQLLKQESVKSE